MKEAIRQNRDITLILLLFLALAFAYSAINPLHEATDELRHYRFVRYIAAHHRLPVQGREECRSQSHHPPLFYLLGAVATGWIETGHDLCYTPPTNPFWAYRYADVGIDNKNQYLHGADEAFPWRGEALAVHIIRALNVLFGAGTVWLTWVTGRAIWPERRALAAGATPFVAFNPMFLYMSGAINNDIIAAFSGAAVLLACVRLLRDPQGLSLRWGAIMGALYGLALMSKFNMAAVVVLIAVVMTVVAWRNGQWRLWWQAALLSAGVAALIAGWWFVRNQLLYGEPTGFRAVTELWGARDPRESLPLAVLELPLAWSTLWGRFGFGQIPLPQVVYVALAWLVLAGLLGVPLALWRSARQGRYAVAGVLALNVLLAFGVLFNYMLVSPAGAMGRFFFPGLPALALLVFYGLGGWATTAGQVLWRGGWDRERTLSPLAFASNAAMLALSLVALLGYLAPAYAQPPAYPATMQLPNASDVQFGGFATLRGYKLSTEALKPGDQLTVDLYWEVNAEPPGNFLYFLHLVDSTGAVVAQRDTHPGTGTFPTGQWQAGDRFVDSLSVYVPETAYTPETLTVNVGLYAPTFRLAVTGADGQTLGDAFGLGTVALQPADEQRVQGSDTPNPMDENFQNELHLRGYAYDGRVLHAGEALKVTLYWQPVGEVQRQYEARLQLLDGNGAVQIQVEWKLAPETWQATSLQAETTALTVPDEASPGPHVVRLVLFDPERNEAHHLVGPGGNFTGEYVDLAPVVVQANPEP